jgi:hypothetical protein
MTPPAYAYAIYSFASSYFFFWWMELKMQRASRPVAAMRLAHDNFICSLSYQRLFLADSLLPGSQAIKNTKQTWRYGMLGHTNPTTNHSIVTRRLKKKIISHKMGS